MKPQNHPSVKIEKIKITVSQPTKMSPVNTLILPSNYTSSEIAVKDSNNNITFNQDEPPVAIHKNDKCD